MLGFVTWQASSTRRSKMIGYGSAFPIPATMILPVFAWLKTASRIFAGPDRVAPVIGRFLVDADRIAGAERRAPVAGDTVPRVHLYLVAFHPEDAVRAVLDTAPAGHAPVLVDLDLEPEGDTADTHATTLPITGSPAFGIRTSAMSGSIRRMAASSLEI